jgi:hypothetical protein
MQLFNYLYDGSSSGHPLTDFIDTKILAALEGAPFYSVPLLAEAVGVCYSTIIRHLRDSLGMKTSICTGCHMSLLRICALANLKFAGDYYQF